MNATILVFDVQNLSRQKDCIFHSQLITNVQSSVSSRSNIEVLRNAQI